MDLTVLRQSDLLRECAAADVDGVVARSREVTVPAGELLFSDDDRADAVWVLLEGELVITKLAGSDEVVIDQLGPGAYLGEISLLTHAPAEHRARARKGVRALRIPGDVFTDLLRSCDAVMQTVLRTMAERVRRMEHLLQQRERMAGLGTMAAGLAHELNNPAAAANRALQLLREEVQALEPLAQQLARRPWSEGEVGLMRRLDEATRTLQQDARELDSLERSDREDAVAEWLDEHAVDRAHELAPLLVERGVTPPQLDALASGCNAPIVADALAWTERMASIRQLIDEANQSTSRISGMVRAVKAYSYVDTTSLRTADVHEGIEGSLTILGHKFREASVTVQREYDRTVPPLQTYGTELTQVWTNLLDNAADALAGRRGTVHVRTARDGDELTVEVVDDGPGIPADVQGKIFDPFFTTKEAGKGTGLGLEIVKRIIARHRGSVVVRSVPGDTRFTVRLPLHQ